jgi:hypothetical protein
MQHLLKIKDWDEIFQINYSKLPVNFIKEYLLLEKLRRKDININNIFIGDYRLLNFKIFSVNLRHNKTFLLDDGTSTFTIQDFYLKDQKEFDGKSFMEWLKKIIAKFIFGFKIHLQEKIHLYTCYNILPHAGQEIVSNKYHYTMSYQEDKAQLNINHQKVYYIGAKYVEAKLMGEDVYITLINKIKQNHKNRKLIYIPHRGEEKSKLDKIEHLGIEVEFLKNIVEIEFLFKEELPGTICGFTSSVLVNIPKIFPQINVIVYQIDEQLFVSTYRNTVKNFYHRFKLGEGLNLRNI